MSKHKFTSAQTYAVWKHHGAICYICEEPLRLQETTVDHFIPEHLEGKEDKFTEVRKAFDLADTFRINDFCNWLPCHIKCNQQKGGVPLKTTFKAMGTVEKLVREAEAVRKIEERIREDKKKDAILAKIMVAVEGNVISKEDILSALADPGLPEDEDVQVLRMEVLFRIDPKRWHVMSLDNTRGLAMVTDGRFAGNTPVNDNPHISWMCPHCGSYGPWNGIRCLTCGHLSDPWD
jgi:hypothetical protein